ncbi:hypothetical protein [Ramlibacter montanisoli]|uniref:Uncharacterized protein n=1 Tax=Ramlibacter montanisoli TaxID=2732512 RepID=A0A849KF87_9BURK|nr:hypothetical protein [Ramlibacter montanisoli]NNU44136.1 hypothetical protein [Ramlibacter montanisoli]
MKKYAALALAAAAAFAVPAFAQSSVTSSTGASVSSGTGVVVTPSLPAASVTATGPHLLSGATLVQSSSTTVMGSGPGATTTVVTNYWANVPAGFERRGDVQRWLSLK